MSLVNRIRLSGPWTFFDGPRKKHHLETVVSRQKRFKKPTKRE
jgi:hypothetical protein